MWAISAAIEDRMGQVVPIAIFLVVQTGGAVWWASNIDNRVERVQTDVAELREREAEGSLEARRRARQNEKTINRLDNVTSVTNANLKSLQKDMENLGQRLKETNSLLQQLLLMEGTVPNAQD